MRWVARLRAQAAAEAGAAAGHLRHLCFTVSDIGAVVDVFYSADRRPATVGGSAGARMSCRSVATARCRRAGLHPVLNRRGISGDEGCAPDRPQGTPDPSSQSDLSNSAELDTSECFSAGSSGAIAGAHETGLVGDGDRLGSVTQGELHDDPTVAHNPTKIATLTA